MTYYATQIYDGDGVTTNYVVAFPYILQSDVAAYVGGALVASTWIDSTHLQLTAPPPLGLQNLIIKRQTKLSGVYATFQSGTVFPGDLNLDETQLLYLIQEVTDLALYNQTSLAVAVAACNAAVAAITALVAGVNVPPASGNVVTVGSTLTGLFETTVVKGSAPNTQLLPAAPNAWETHTIVDGNGTAAVNRISVSGNGKTIAGTVGNFAYVESNWGSVKLRWDAADNQWLIVG